MEKLKMKKICQLQLKLKLNKNAQLNKRKDKVKFIKMNFSIMFIKL